MNAGRVAVLLLAWGLLASCSTTAPQVPPTGPATVTVTAPAGPTSAPVSTIPVSVPATSAASAPASATSSGPWTLSVNGLGPLVLGTKISTLVVQGHVVLTPGECAGVASSPALEAQGVFIYPSGEGANAVLSEVSLSKPTYTTLSGAKVGDTMKKIKQLYGSQLTIETKNGNGGPFQVAHVKVGTREVVFYFPYGSAMVDTDVVQTIIARNYSVDMMGEC